MNNFTSKFLIVVFFFSAINIFGQEENKQSNKLFNQDLTLENQRSIDETGFIRCGTVEYESYLKEGNTNKQSLEEFEVWLESKKQETISRRMASPNEILTIPVVFHIFTDGSGAENISAALVQAQIDQLNIDYKDLAGSTYASSGSAELEFCLAQQDASGNPLNEAGINRITIYGQGPFADNDFENTMKAATQWDPTKYMNVWVGDLSGGLLGYAHWPESSTLSGVPGNSTGANRDGVVVLYSSVGSVANPNPNGGQYANGRTLTHEAGHWLGLRHIWGDDATCNNSDYCADTPDADTEHYSCVTEDTCPSDGLGKDMVENYMDYTNDLCMNTFTDDQVTRILTVMANSPRRVELTTSNVCQPAQTYDLDGKLEIGNLNLDNCNGFYAPEIIITNKGNNTLTSATISYYLDANTPVNINWNGNLVLDASETISLPQMSTSIASHTFNATLSNPNGGTDEQLGNNTTSSNFSITGTVCTSVANTTFETSTTGVIFNTISNLNTGKPSGYSDYTNLSTDVTQGSSYDLSVYANSDGSFQIITYAWIDWNQNCTFDDPGEEYDLGTSSDINNELTVNSPLSITVPANAVSGNTIMRITTKYTSPNANQFPTSCENGHDAEVEDYTVNVIASVGIKDYAFASFNIYPNPSEGIFNINLQSNNSEDTVIQLYDMRGRLITQQTLSNNQTNIQTQLDFSQVNQGIYLLKVSKGNELGTKQVIIN